MKGKDLNSILRAVSESLHSIAHVPEVAVRTANHHVKPSMDQPRTKIDLPYAERTRLPEYQWPKKPPMRRRA